jgi:hypothetical protein
MLVATTTAKSRGEAGRFSRCEFNDQCSGMWNVWYDILSREEKGNFYTSR